ncbi:glycosyltransferase [Agromyces protaetiae]|uniref:Glycosyltransferase n=1 Tax=Agromyces protaetiae TaxID=2509455 RepID=A0A4P6FF57_9MICO|nr:glycosyltransferase family 2 protein [Agromyces protaetiae]QAY74575.1 glycosyltransferase [Agromyces protaetiae]
MSPTPNEALPDVSIVIPSYNSAPWLPTTFEALARAVRASGLAVQVVFVDDGSTDDTESVVERIAAAFPGTVELHRQTNQGRFLARWAGLKRSRATATMLLDSRVLVDVDSLVHYRRVLAEEPSQTVWNGHVPTVSDAPLVGRFWEVPTHIFWAHYLRRPRPMDITPENFDSVPKGTTIFLAPTDLLREAFRGTWPADDARLVSDDTKLLRWLVEAHPIRLDPGFSALYRPRTTVRGFVSHTFDRGTLFVDSYAGTTPARSIALIAFALAPIALVVVLVWLVVAGLGAVALGIALASILLALAPALLAAINRCPPRALLAYVAVLPLFVVPFWLGLVRGLFVHRRAFLRRGALHPSTSEEHTAP